MNQSNDYWSALDRSCLITVINETGAIVHANENVCNNSGYTFDEFRKMHVTDLFPEYKSQDLITEIHASAAQAGMWKGILIYRRKDGISCNTEMSVVPHCVEGSNGYMLLGLGGKPGTQRAGDYKRYKHFFDNQNDMVGIANDTGYFEEVNHAFCRELGLTKDEIYSTPFIDLVHPEDVAATIKAYEDLMAGALVTNFMNRYRKSDGTYIWLDWNATPDPVTGKINCITRNFTARKKIEEELQHSLKETRDYKYALDESSIVAITDTKGTIIHANDNFCRISQYSREELIGQDHRIINSGYHDKEFIRNLWVTIANGRIWQGALLNKAKDGTLYWMDTSIIPFLNEQGKPYQYIAIRSDITGSKKTEEQLLAVNKELESFSYSVSHDLRAPLRAVTGYARMLEDKYRSQLDDEAKRIINNISLYGKQMGQLVDDLLGFSRMGRKDIVKSRINMNNLVAEVKEELMQGQKDRAVEFHISELHPGLGDRPVIKQVWINLISNALKYTGGKERAVIEIKSEMNADLVTYSIKDNGAGFDMEYAHKLFGVFQRLHSDDEFEGTGIGLALVQRIIARHGGTVAAEGKVNEGATFRFVLQKP